MSEDETIYEYRLRWSASSNITFHGESDWIEWGPAASVGEVMDDLFDAKPLGLPPGLEGALECSGFEWDCDVRTVPS